MWGYAGASGGERHMRLRQSLRRARGHAWPRLRARAALIALAAFALAGCANGDPAVTGSIPAFGMKTIAFESVDGPPRPVFDRLVSALSAEAERRDLPFVSHTGPAAYRVRAYLATYVEKKKKQATLAWAWEVFDTQSNRAFRRAGEEPLGKGGTDVWGQCDDALLLRIATKGFDELAARLGPIAPAAAAPAGEPAPVDPAIASAGTARTIAFTNIQ